MTHICVGKLSIIGSDNGLSPRRRQAIIWTNAVILLIGPLGTNFNEILIEINIFSFKKMRLKMSSGKWRPFCPGLNVLSMGYVMPNQVLNLPTYMDLYRIHIMHLTKPFPTSLHEPVVYNCSLACYVYYFQHLMICIFNNIFNDILYSTALLIYLFSYWWYCARFIWSSSHTRQSIRQTIGYEV